MGKLRLRAEQLLGYIKSILIYEYDRHCNSLKHERNIDLI
jgi:hypothetical protein